MELKNSAHVGIVLKLTHVYICSLHFGNYTGGNAKKMAKLVSRGSAGCIAAMDEMNPRNLVRGDEPWVGVKLRVQWARFLSMETNPPI